MWLLCTQVCMKEKMTTWWWMQLLKHYSRKERSKSSIPKNILNSIQNANYLSWWMGCSNTHKFHKRATNKRVGGWWESKQPIIVSKGLSWTNSWTKTLSDSYNVTMNSITLLFSRVEPYARVVSVCLPLDKSLVRLILFCMRLGTHESMSNMRKIGHYLLHCLKRGQH